MSRACIIGAGSSGIASCQVLHARGIPFHCFEAGSAVGGNWLYNNDNGMSSAYRSLHANSSRRAMQFATFPMPENYPSYLSHKLIAKYFDDFVDYFGFRHEIQFRTVVTRAEPAPGGGWDVTIQQRDTGAKRTERYSAVLVANGHHWDPRYPEPAFPGAGNFIGEQIHSHHYRTPEPFTGKRTLVLGIGNSACDVAVDCSQVAERTLLAVEDQILLYHRVIPPKLPGLYFIGLVQPIGASMPIAEIQSEWVADLLQGHATLPSEAEMNREIAKYRAVTARRYARSTRPAIQVDFLAYLSECLINRRAWLVLPGLRRGGR